MNTESKEVYGLAGAVYRLRLLTWCSATLMACAAVGCNGEALGVNPAPVLSPATDAASEAAVDAAPGNDAQSDAGPRIREVLHRDPWGPLDPANMLHDGDFELSGLNAIQYPWFGTEQSFIRTGAGCRSGLRCLEMPPGNYVIGVFVWPDAPSVEVSFHGKPTSSQDCETEAVGLVLALDMQNGPETRIGPETTKPVDGWCRYSQTLPVPQNPGYHYWGFLLATRSEATGSVVFDGAAMVGTEDTVALPFSLAPLTASDAAMSSKARKRVKALLPPNPPYRPTPVKNPTGKRGGVR